MPKRKSSRRTTAVRRAYHVATRVSRSARRVYHRATKGGMGHWGTKLLYGIAGYLTPDLIEQLGIGWAIHQQARARGGPIGNAIADSMDTAYSSYGIRSGNWVGKAAGLGILLNNIRQGKGLDNKTAFAIGMVADDPAGTPTSQGSTGYWNST